MKKQWNWSLWFGFLAVLAGLISYPFFIRFAMTRDFPWVNFLLFGVGLALLGLGLVWAFGRPAIYRGKIVGPIFGLLGLLVAGFFCYIIFFELRQLPASVGAPRVGEKAMGFTLPDQNDHDVSLADLLTAPLPNAPTAKTAAVLLIFYRGFW
jgi:drug/metabolite transporter (DMT)-like permease